MRNYYKKNVAMAQKLQVERVFVLYRDRIIDRQSNAIDSGVLGVLKRQHNDRIKVHVAWDVDLKEKSYIEDLIVVDERLVEYGIDAGGFVSSEWPDREAFISFDRRRVKEYISRFELLKSFSLPLAEWLEENKTYVPSGFVLTDTPAPVGKGN